MQGDFGYEQHYQSWSVWLSGDVSAGADWSGERGARLFLTDAWGNVIAGDYADDGHAYFETRVSPGWYRVTLGRWSDWPIHYSVSVRFRTGSG